MTRQNRRRKAHFKAANCCLWMLFAVAVLPWVAYSLLLSSNNQIATQIRQLENRQLAQQSSVRRQTAEWNRLTEPHRLDEAIARNGLVLNYAPPERSVRVEADGRMLVSHQLQARMQELADARREASETVRTASASGHRGRSRRR